MKLELNGLVTPDGAFAAEDVRTIKTALTRLGFYRPGDGVGITEEADPGLWDSLYAFQRRHAIFFGDTDVGPGSTTERILNRELAAMEGSGAYIWRTAGDDKVRGTHASRAGVRSSWEAPPEGGHPGEDYNCRCWAEPARPPYHPWIEWVEKRRQEREARSVVAENLAPPRGINDGLENPIPLDAINPTWSPFDFLSWSAVLGAKLAGRTIGAEIAKRQAIRDPYEVALRGGAHARFLRMYKNVSSNELKKGLKSFDKQINCHFEKVKNPESEIPDCKNLDKRHQKDLLDKKWPLDIKRLKEQKEILRRILNERN